MSPEVLVVQRGHLFAKEDAYYRKGLKLNKVNSKFVVNNNTICKTQSVSSRVFQQQHEVANRNLFRSGISATF